MPQVQHSRFHQLLTQVVQLRIGRRERLCGVRCSPRQRYPGRGHGRALWAYLLHLSGPLAGVRPQRERNTGSTSHKMPIAPRRGSDWSRCSLADHEKKAAPSHKCNTVRPKSGISSVPVGQPSRGCYELPEMCDEARALHRASHRSKEAVLLSMSHEQGTLKIKNKVRQTQQAQQF